MPTYTACFAYVFIHGESKLDRTAIVEFEAVNENAAMCKIEDALQRLIDEPADARLKTKNHPYVVTKESETSMSHDPNGEFPRMSPTVCGPTAPTGVDAVCTLINRLEAEVVNLRKERDDARAIYQIPLSPSPRLALAAAAYGASKRDGETPAHVCVMLLGELAQAAQDYRT